MKMSNFEKIFVNSPGHSNQVSRHAAGLLERIGPAVGQSYLDVGCGNGTAPIHIAKTYQLEVTGVDVDPEQIREAKKQSAGMANVQFFVLDGVQLPFEEGEFDMVATNKVMHHIPGWQNAFMEMIRVLKPNGFLIYNDLVYPEWLAAAGKILARKQAGFPTKGDVEKLVKMHQLYRVHYSASVAHYEAIFQKLAVMADEKEGIKNEK